MVNPEDLKLIANYINTTYNGKPGNLASNLDNIIYLLHFVDEDIERKEVQNLVDTLKSLSNCLQGKSAPPY